MAYNNGFPMMYQSPYQMPQMQMSQQIPQQMQQIPQQPQQMQQPQQIQNGGFMLVPSEDIVRTYPVAPGNCVTFKIEGKPIVMEKSMGFSQLEAPRVDRYRLVREEDIQAEPEPVKEQHNYDEDIAQLKDKLQKDIDSLWSEIDVLRGQISKPTTTKKKENGGT